MKFDYIDIHTHVNINAFAEDWKEVVQKSFDEKVAIINIGTQKDTSARAIEIAEGFESGLYATVGIHPIHTNKSYHDEAELGESEKGFVSRGEQFNHSLYKSLAESKKVVAIGECGLDYYRVDEETRVHQEAAFIGQIELANELDLPLMLHIRAREGRVDAYEDALKLLKQYAKVRGNVHFFASSYDIAKQFWDMGYTTSFTGVITFARDYDDVVKNAPLEMLQAETDAPYVAPKPYRGQRNEPVHVREVYAKLAELRNEDKEEVRLALLKNAEELFNIPLV